MEKVSVILPVYLNGNGLQDSIQSILSQSYTDFHLYIIDDVLDGTVETQIQHFNDERISYHKNTGIGGRAAAINRGIVLAKGDYIAFSACGALWAEDKLSIQVGILKTNRYDVVCSKYARSKNQDLPPPAKMDAREELISYKALLRNNKVACFTSIYNAKKVGKVYVEDVAQAEYLMWLSILSRAANNTAFCFPDPLVIYHPQSQKAMRSSKQASGWKWGLYRTNLKLPYHKSFYYYFSNVTNSMIKYAQGWNTPQL
ncbi:glycosyltransferase family 2 protein [Edaphovirga cremea]|uniref:glycosyltransferase family 2 protein n=1 Tax=Edaphovirga cremea TaxID=2267246 RepID=UPI000DEFC464|nr:glycosyltransferase family 2 protein [Edaphovirga cremea]